MTDEVQESRKGGLPIPITLSTTGLRLASTVSDYWFLVFTYDQFERCTYVLSY